MLVIFLGGGGEPCVEGERESEREMGKLKGRVEPAAGPKGSSKRKAAAEEEAAAAAAAAEQAVVAEVKELMAEVPQEARSRSKRKDRRAASNPNPEQAPADDQLLLEDVLALGGTQARATRDAAR